MKCTLFKDGLHFISVWPVVNPALVCRAETYPRSTRKESLQVLLFLLNWNLGQTKQNKSEKKKFS